MFYDRFLELCERDGTTPRRVALDLGIKPSTLSMWKTKGVTPNTDTVIKLANYFSVQPDCILGGELPPSDKKTLEFLGVTFARELNRLVAAKRDGASEEEIERLEKYSIIFNTQMWEYVPDAIVDISLSYGTDTDCNISESLFVAIHKLNAEGRNKAIERVEELTEIPRYRAETTPQPPPAPQEGPDTTQPPEGAEGPQEGE